MKRLVYLSPVSWASFVQRPHRFVEWFRKRTGGEVLWIDPYPTRLPEWADFRRTRPDALPSDGSAVPPWLKVLRPRALPIEPLVGARLVHGAVWRELLEAIGRFLAIGDGMVVVGKPSDLALLVLDRGGEALSVYDAMDDFPAFYCGLSRASMARRESVLAQRVERILVSSSSLRARFRRHHAEKVSLTLNACEIDLMPPVEALRRRRGRGVLGYVGTIGRWFDWPLVLRLAHSNPGLEVHIVGPMFVPPPADLPPNVILQPACDHKTAIATMSGFSAGMIPFRKTELTESVDPIKYYEYVALGLPVLSTRFGEMCDRIGSPGVLPLDDECDLSQLAQAALAFRPDLDKLNLFRSLNSWDARFDQANLI